MKTIPLILLLSGSLVACNFQQPESHSTIETLKAKELEAQSPPGATAGVLISTVEFKVKARQEEQNAFEGGIIPWISVENAENEAGRLIEAETVVLSYSEVKLIIDYPLNSPATFVLKSLGKGFTKKQLALEISKKYHEVYEVEERTATTKIIPMEKRKDLINRNETDGKYGIWGHDIGDLDLSSVEVYKTTSGEIYLQLGIES